MEESVDLADLPSWKQLFDENAKLKLNLEEIRNAGDVPQAYRQIKERDAIIEQLRKDIVLKEKNHRRAVLAMTTDREEIARQKIAKNDTIARQTIADRDAIIEQLRVENAKYKRDSKRLRSEMSSIEKRYLDEYMVGVRGDRGDRGDRDDRDDCGDLGDLGDLGDFGDLVDPNDVDDETWHQMNKQRRLNERRRSMPGFKP
jgi:hypothetical protein